MTANGREETAIVVGAGIVGIACAHYLNKAGLKVTVIDKSTVAGACSHANCGYICPSHVPPLTEPGALRVLHDEVGALDWAVGQAGGVPADQFGFPAPDRPGEPVELGDLGVGDVGVELDEACAGCHLVVGVVDAA